MDNKGFIENGFIIDLGNSKSAADMIFELSNILEIPEAKGKKICLKLGEVDLTKSQLLSIQSLISSMGSEVAFVDTNSDKTELAALSLGLIVSELSNKIETPESTPEVLKISKGLEDEPEVSEELSETTIYEKLDTETVAEEIIEEKIEVVEKTEDELEAEEKLEELIDTEIEEEEKEVSQCKQNEEEIAQLPTLYLQQTLRSGKTISYDGNIIVIGDVHPGSEVIAKGDITVWGVLGGIAHAGARGNECAKIRALKMHAIQLRISGFYARRPDSLNIPYIQKSSQFTPEEARIKNGEIAIYKTYG